MEVNEKELKDKRLQLAKEVEQLQIQLQQAQQLVTLLPLRIASRQGEIIGIDNILGKWAGKQKNNKAGK